MSKSIFHKKAIIALLFITILWSLSFIFSSSMMHHKVSSEILLFSRFGLGALVLFIINFKNIIKMSKYDLLGGLLVGLSVLFAIYFQNVGFMMTSVSKIAFISSMNIVFIPFLAYFINKSKIRKRHLCGLFFAVLGVCFLSLNFNDLATINMGDLFALLSALGFAMQVVLIKKFASKVDPANLTFIHAIVVSLGGFLITTLNKGDIGIAFNKDNLISLLYLSIIAMAFCYSIQAWASKYVGEVLTSILISTQAIFGSAFDVMIFKTPITFQLIIGAILMAIALYVLMAPIKYLPIIRLIYKRT
ncbi:MAG: DMT family transporter [Bacilli bacterium]|jgi:drug/metabolite transporter (DMT)-like permease|nr:DMT family transporter [Bacilli bacterium]